MTPMGKVLRMNSDGSAPTDNPFVGNSSWNPLVYTYGHRNMFGIAFRPTTGQAYVTENGPEDSDEINRLVPGGNYGWPAVKGIANNPSYIDPIRVYSRVIVPTNAAFYTATVPAAARNRLVFGTYLTNELRALALDADGSQVLNETVLATATAPIIDVEMGPDGYLWVTTPSAIYRLVPSATASPPVLPLGHGIAALALLDSWAAAPWVRTVRPRKDRATDHPGSLSRDTGVLASVRCRRTGSRATTGWSNRCGGS
jgi:glucose/arabinose dehydrogenase